MLPRNSRIVLVAALCSVAAGLKIKSELEDLEKMKAKGAEQALAGASVTRDCDASSGFPEYAAGLVPAVTMRTSTEGEGSGAVTYGTAAEARTACADSADTCCGIVNDGSSYNLATNCGTRTKRAQMDACNDCGVTFCEFAEPAREAAAASDTTAAGWDLRRTFASGGKAVITENSDFLSATAVIKTRNTGRSSLENGVDGGDGMTVAVDIDGEDTTLVACYRGDTTPKDGCETIWTAKGDKCAALAVDGSAHDGGLAYVGCDSGTFHLVDLATKEAKMFTNTEFRPSGAAPASEVTHIAGKGATAITAGKDGYIWFWDLASGASSVIGRPSEGALTAMSFTLFEGDADSPAAILVTGTTTGHIIKWEISTKDRDYGAASTALEVDTGSAISDLSVDGEATMVAVASAAGSGVLSLADGATIFAESAGPRTAVSLATIGVNSGPAVYAVVGGPTNKGEVIDLRTGLSVHTFDAPHTTGVALRTGSGCILWERATGSSSETCTCQGLVNYFDGGVARDMDDYATAFAAAHDCGSTASSKACGDYAAADCPMTTCVLADGKCMATAPTPAPTLYKKPTPAPTPAPTKWVAQKMWFENIPVIGSFLREIWDTALDMQIIGTLVRAINFFPEKAFNETKKQLDKVKPLTDAVKDVGDALLSKDDSMMANQQAGLALNQQEEAPSTALPVLGKNQAADIISDLKSALQ